MGTTGNNDKSRIYTASKTRSEGRSAWAITFRHPLRVDTKKVKQGLKIRRSLKTTSETDADQLVENMNEILANQEWWSLSRRTEAEKRFGEAVAGAFYDAIEEAKTDSRAIRESELHLPSREDGYAKVLFVGTTGAGKTTLLRHLIGSHPENDRFPSTSTAKTTISDIELILDGTDYKAVVTFFPENSARTAIHECLTEACVAAMSGASDEEIADQLLNHKDQKFRFSYVLGQWQSKADFGSDDDWEFGSISAETSGDPEQQQDQQERHRLQSDLEGYVARVKTLSLRALNSLNSTLEQDIRTLDGADREAALSMYEDELQADSEFDEIIADILEAVLDRFELIVATGKLERRKSGWPEKWVFSTTDRNEFISKIKFFSSNAATSFGRLLTPLVDGIRVRGPLFPEFTNRRVPLVLLDGQGLGHTPDVSGAISTHITGQFNQVDVILLVDNAQNPIQSSPLSVIRFAATAGYERKLAVVFTHFDQVRGINLPHYQDKRNHVLASLKNGITSLREVAGSAVSSLETRILARCFMLGGIDRPSRELPNGPKQELDRLLDLFEASLAPATKAKMGPVYDTAGLMFAVQTAADDFHRLWNARLGFTWMNGIDKEHWTRVRALARRLALQMDNLEYDNLRPIADLLLRLQEAISKFLDNPTSWHSKPQTEEDEVDAINSIRQDVSMALHDLTRARLADGQLQNWLAAFDESGRGSANRRALRMRGIYEEAAPVPSVIISETASQFLDAVREVVHSAIETAGGEVRFAPLRRTTSP